MQLFIQVPLLPSPLHSSFHSLSVFMQPILLLLSQSFLSFNLPLSLNLTTPPSVNI